MKFGDDGSAQFAALSGMGAFFDATTDRIFEGSCEVRHFRVSGFR